MSQARHVDEGHDDSPDFPITVAVGRQPHQIVRILSLAADPSLNRIRTREHLGDIVRKAGQVQSARKIRDRPSLVRRKDVNTFVTAGVKLLMTSFLSRKMVATSVLSNRFCRSLLARSSASTLP